MAKVEDCPGFETFGADVKAARKAKHLTRKVLAEIVGIEWRYLANIENKPPGCDPAYQSLRASRGAVFQPGNHTRGQRTAAAGQPQAETLPGTLFASH